jgi:hypothetical protein
LLTCIKDAACSTLSKGKNFAETSAVVLVEDILRGVEKVTGALPEETDEEVWQETGRIL